MLVSASLPAWVPSHCPDTATDHGERVLHAPGEPAWVDCGDDALELRVLELLRHSGRLVAELRTRGAATCLPDCRGLELFVRRGSVTIDGERLGPGTYMRFPPESERVPSLVLDADTLLALSAGHILHSDTETRIIDTRADDEWLTGPVEGVEILPLHGHGTGNIMLVRWLATAAFHPNLDPAGEEVFVLAGELHDSAGTYGTDGWVRNPVPAWQSWAGTPGTLIWYKSGHFPSDVSSASDSSHSA